MSSNIKTASRGRPKTLNRDLVIDKALTAYWHEGVERLSLNEVCRRCDISKPAMYREFGNEDGLMTAVLGSYQQQILTPLLNTLTAEIPFREALDNLITTITTVNGQQAPMGCLLVKMRESRLHLGEEVQAQIECTYQYVLNTYAEWVEKGIAQGQLGTEMPTQFLAVYIEAQLSHALSQLVRGEDSETVKKMLQLALSML